MREHINIATVPMGTQFRMCLAYQTVGSVVCLVDCWVFGKYYRDGLVVGTPTEYKLLSISNTKASFYFYIVKNTKFSSCEKMLHFENMQPYTRRKNLGYSAQG